MSHTVIPEKLVAAYQSTNYRVFSEHGDFVFKIGQRSDELSHLFESMRQRGSTLISAENPFSKSATADENALKQSHLHGDLASLGATILDGAGQGQDPAWPAESSFLAIGVSRAQACALGHKYHQNAIVWIDERAVPELVLLR